ncbi:hypothetical protein SARC_05357 [Sphaeroforma arctica JP610]|uniref:Uncharacterized protein n=1 Tax=Sphaeroforma arctica JP610 TaxID=667725 RepID=A0A0L0G0H9_9EUKA|nr:hypothetical protein SARC_05357 [Sphaeroforma arctica JP610]KNC82364.1 hypothetical protein SARC_05357 [Sphaeroforma arctica JP610]|eukprot:XP_014156266.1 hypothetical protein SARC_05357 [Sphaeroforma arctica JP610]
MLYTFLPDKRTLFSRTNSDALPADCIFAGTGSAHAAILGSIVSAKTSTSTIHYKETEIKLSSTKGKHKRLPRADLFRHPADHRLREAEKLAAWLQDAWYAGLANADPSIIVISDEEDDADEEEEIETKTYTVDSRASHNTPHASDNSGSANSNTTSANTESSTPITSSSRVEKRGRKPLEDGLVRYMLLSLDFKCVLPGRINNDPIEVSFSIARAMAGGNHT